METFGDSSGRASWRDRVREPGEELGVGVGWSMLQGGAEEHSGKKRTATALLAWGFTV